MLQILCEIWIECSLKHSKKNLPKINKIEATLDSVQGVVLCQGPGDDCTVYQ